MSSFARTLAAIAVLAGSLFAAAPARADGALVVGDCSAYGYSYNYGDEAGAKERALQECRKAGGKNCKLQVTFYGNCMAFATDHSRSCGAWGWSTRNTKSLAETAARAQCSKYGGRDCRVRAAVCDSPPAPALTTNWRSMDYDQQECLRRGETAMKGANLTVNFEVVGESVFGEQGSYTGQIRCIAEKHIAVFVLIGSKLDQASSYLTAIFDGFVGSTPASPTRRSTTPSYDNQPSSGEALPRTLEDTGH